MSILDLFAKSPIKPLQEHMHVVVECVRVVRPLVQALCDGDIAGIATHFHRIDELEGQADLLKNDLRAHLPRRLLLPVDRRDLLEILDFQDSIADIAQDIGGLLEERPLPVPDSMKQPLMELVGGVERTCVQTGEVIDLLDELLETGFRGREADRVEMMIDEVGKLEEHADRFETILKKELFRLEDGIPPVSVFFWYQVIDWIGDLADNSEKVGNRLRLLVAR